MYINKWLGLCCCAVLSHGAWMTDTSLVLNEIHWQPEMTRIFMGSPSILVSSSGDYLASADRFGTGHHLSNVSIYRSRDKGDTWTFETWVLNAYFATLFERNGIVYLLGTDGGSPPIAKIHASFDDGRTWNASSTLFGTHGGFGYATGAMPVLESNGYLFRAMELDVTGAWPLGFQANVMYAPRDADLLNASSWKQSNILPFNNSWIPADWPAPDKPGFLEGNMVEAPDGSVYNILRLNVRPAVLGNYAIALKCSDVCSTITFDRIFPFPGGHSKFAIRRDPESGLYLTFSNINDNIEYQDQRNILVFAASADLFNWTVVQRVLSDDTGFTPDDSVRYTGFHYVDWQFDGSDLVYAIRTGYRGSVSYHNSNRLTFKRLENWKRAALKMQDIQLGNGMLMPSFAPEIENYTLYVDSFPTRLNITVMSAFCTYSLNGGTFPNNRPTQLLLKGPETLKLQCINDTSLAYMLTVAPHRLAADLSFKGNFSMEPFCEGCRAFLNRAYTLQDIQPELAHGFNFTMFNGGEHSTLEATATSSGYAIVFGDAAMDATYSPSWERYSTWDAAYSSAGGTALHCYIHKVQPDDVIQLPQTGFTGVMGLKHIA